MVNNFITIHIDLQPFVLVLVFVFVFLCFFFGLKYTSFLFASNLLEKNHLRCAKKAFS